MKILYVVGNFTCGGIETSVLNIIDNIEKSEFTIDVLLFQNSPKDWGFQLKDRNINIIIVPGVRQGVLKFMKNMKRIIIDGKYELVHSHIGYLSAFIGIVCKTIKIPCICHSHNSDAGSFNKYIPIIRILFSLSSPIYVGASEEAGKFLFGKNKKVNVIFNSINSQQFCFDSEKRRKIRNEYDIDNSVVLLGYVARLSPEKNHKFLIEGLSKIENINMKLILVGDGNEFESLTALVKQLNLEKKVIFTGAKTNANDYLSAMDFFVFPSRYEGFGIALLEAQCCGLPIIAFESIPKLVQVTDLIHFTPCESTFKDWYRYIEQECNSPMKDRLAYHTQVAGSKYGMDSMMKALVTLYYTTVKGGKSSE